MVHGGGWVNRQNGFDKNLVEAIRMKSLHVLCLTVLGLLPLGCVAIGALPLGEDPQACTFKDGAAHVFHGKPEGRVYTELAIVTAQTA
jgi:hypothetical protein